MLSLTVLWPQPLDRRMARWGTLAKAQAQFMPTVERLMIEDNRAGLLAGTDRHGHPLTPLATSTLLRRHFTLSTKPLIPHGIQSRAIKNYRVTSTRRSDGSWISVGAWQNVLSKRGTPFMAFHVQGAGYNPVRDIAGVRPATQQKIRAAYKVWLHDFIYN